MLHDCSDVGTISLKETEALKWGWSRFKKFVFENSVSLPNISSEEIEVFDEFAFVNVWHSMTSAFLSHHLHAAQQNK